MNPSTAAARVVVDELARCGVRTVVVCPGSRNAPLSIALHEASLAGRITVHVRVDERSAGFFALGLARGFAGRAGVALVCTSGTAVANLHPAVLEARHSGHGLLLITADRPAELLGTGANQTIDQRGIFGSAATLVDFPLAERRAGQNAIWRATLCRAVAAMADGPVQLNLPLRDPLVPDGTVDWPEALDGRVDGGPWTRWPAPRIPAAQPVPDLGPRPLLVLGDGDPDLLAEAARTAQDAGWPVLAEPTAVGFAQRPVRNANLIMSTATLPERLAPTGIVIAGRPTLARWVARLMRATPVVHVVDADPQWTDPAHVATSVGQRLRPEDLPGTATETDWLADWHAADATVSATVDKQLADAPWPTGLRLARELTSALPEDALLFLGSSNAIRLVDLAGAVPPGRTVLANRGVAGIDGNTSTAAGLAIASGRPGYALLGDLTFLHDSNGLLIGPDDQRPDLTVVVLNDAGGGIFSLLEQGAPEHAASFERVFGTPHQVEIGALCAAHRVPHRLVDSVEALRAALAPEPGLRVIEIKASRADLRAEHAALRRAADEALNTVFG